MPKHKKMRHASKSKSCNCNIQFEKIRKQLDRIEDTIESKCVQPPTETRCECSANFNGLKIQTGGSQIIEGTICNNCRFGIELGFAAPGIDFQGVLIEAVTCLINNTMTATGIGRLSGKLVDFELFLTRNPNTIRLRVFKCQETFIDTTFTGAEIGPLFSITRCPR
ncbi:hypothetical protein RCG17_00460 [Neobacillus sp. PS3-12]|uniref:hypothetical protein n=1 Tax=Neobacillus sp. PS3-12 TaxID=3070677 RepID=UPI0027E0CBEB|nr:hypothetical protein [Neobacillus sp. PS3-12]WML53225.1 hypothetical protein RCG17_00460 [Neobacillus sp. PS3-12]